MNLSRPSLQGKTVVITGASRGIGKAIALRFAKDGASTLSLGEFFVELIFNIKTPLLHVLVFVYYCASRFFVINDQDIVILAKTENPHPKLEGTIYSAAKEIEAIGGKALPLACDIRFEDQVRKAIGEAVKKFGGIDILVNNASAINLSGTLQLDMSRYDLMSRTSERVSPQCGTFFAAFFCLCFNPCCFIFAMLTYHLLSRYCYCFRNQF